MLSNLVMVINFHIRTVITITRIMSIILVMRLLATYVASYINLFCKLSVVKSQKMFSDVIFA